MVMVFLIVISRRGFGQGSERENRSEEQEARETLHKNPTISEFSGARSAGSNAGGGILKRRLMRRLHRGCNRTDVKDGGSKTRGHATPSVRYISAMDARSVAPTLRNMRCTWFFTVCSERFRRAATSLLERPSRINCASCCCLGLRSRLFLRLTFGRPIWG